MSGRGMVLVTGGSGGIGLACCRALLDVGFGIAVMGRRAELVNRAVDELRDSRSEAVVAGYPGDVSDREQVDATVDALLDSYGPIYALVASAAVSVEQPILESSGDDWDATLGSGVRGSAFCSAAVARHMRAQGGGRIVLLSSISSAVVYPGGAAYCADKAAVSSLARSLAVELAPFGIVANAVAPGWVRTSMIEPYLPDDPLELTRINPLGRVAEPEEIASLVRYLVADAPTFLTGATLLIDGGATARGPFI